MVRQMIRRLGELSTTLPVRYTHPTIGLVSLDLGNDPDVSTQYWEEGMSRLDSPPSGTLFGRFLQPGTYQVANRASLAWICS
jgi:hypothetical protein